MTQHGHRAKLALTGGLGSAGIDQNSSRRNWIGSLFLPSTGSDVLFHFYYVSGDIMKRIPTESPAWKTEIFAVSPETVFFFPQKPPDSNTFNSNKIKLTRSILVNLTNPGSVRINI